LKQGGTAREKLKNDSVVGITFFEKRGTGAINKEVTMRLKNWRRLVSVGEKMGGKLFVKTRKKERGLEVQEIDVGGKGRGVWCRGEIKVRQLAYWLRFARGTPGRKPKHRGDRWH